jgi:hypothetical protein
MSAEMPSYTNDAAGRDLDPNYAQPRAVMDDANAAAAAATQAGRDDYATVRSLSVHTGHSNGATSPPARPTKDTTAASSASGGDDEAVVHTGKGVPVTAAEMAQFPNMTLEAAQVRLCTPHGARCSARGRVVGDDDDDVRGGDDDDVNGGGGGGGGASSGGSGVHTCAWGARSEKI